MQRSEKHLVGEESLFGRVARRLVQYSTSSRDQLTRRRTSQIGCRALAIVVNLALVQKEGIILTA